MRTRHSIDSQRPDPSGYVQLVCSPLSEKWDVSKDEGRLVSQSNRALAIADTKVHEEFPDPRDDLDLKEILFAAVWKSLSSPLAMPTRAGQTKSTVLVEIGSEELPIEKSEYLDKLEYMSPLKIKSGSNEKADIDNFSAWMFESPWFGMQFVCLMIGADGVDVSKLSSDEMKAFEQGFNKLLSVLGVFTAGNEESFNFLDRFDAFIAPSDYAGNGLQLLTISIWPA